MNIVKLSTKLIFGWMVFISIQICILSNYADSEQKSYYTFGPNNNLFILGLQINTKLKYIGVVLYCMINSSMRAMKNDILVPWLINNVQNEESKVGLTKYIGYNITSVSVFYNWFDYFLCLNIFLSQIDIMLYEIFSDVLISNITTYYYINSAKKVESIENIETTENPLRNLENMV